MTSLFVSLKRHKLNRLICIAFLIAVPMLAQAQNPSEPPVQPKTHGGALRWVRRATLVGSCVAGTVVNNWALHGLASQPGVRLSGPFFSNGKPQYGALIGIGAGTCAITAFTQETNVFGAHSRRSDLIDTFANVGSAGLSTWETLSFLSLSDKVRAAQRSQPGTLSLTSIH